MRKGTKTIYLSSRVPTETISFCLYFLPSQETRINFQNLFRLLFQVTPRKNGSCFTLIPPLIVSLHPIHCLGKDAQELVDKLGKHTRRHHHSSEDCGPLACAVGDCVRNARCPLGGGKGGIVFSFLQPPVSRAHTNTVNLTLCHV